MPTKTFFVVVTSMFEREGRLDIKHPPQNAEMMVKTYDGRCFTNTPSKPVHQVAFFAPLIIGQLQALRFSEFQK